MQFKPDLSNFRHSLRRGPVAQAHTHVMAEAGLVSNVFECVRSKKWGVTDQLRQPEGGSLKRFSNVHGVL